MGAGPPLQCKLFQWQELLHVTIRRVLQLMNKSSMWRRLQIEKNQDLKCFYVLEKVPLVVIYHVHRVMVGVNIS